MAFMSVNAEGIAVASACSRLLTGFPDEPHFSGDVCQGDIKLAPWQIPYSGQATKKVNDGFLCTGEILK
jgi:hypothetical protein